LDKTVWIIAGPTASGKTALAAGVAGRHKGTVVNADSMQIYTEIPVLSAQPTEEERLQAPHLLYGFQSILENFSAAAWAAKALETIRAIHAEDRRAVLVGGSGLYFQALIHGFAPMPVVSPAIRKHVTDLYEMLGPDSFHKALQEIDPETAARLHATDRQRMIRAREVFEASGQPLSAWQSQPKINPAPDLKYRAVVLAPKRDWLHPRINTRFENMMENGALQEAAAIHALNPDPTLTGTRALGLQPLRDHLDARLTREEAVEQAQLETRQYAKRQMTWFRGQKLTDDTLFLEMPELAPAEKFLQSNGA